jgi:hypothetical protein
MPEYRYTVPDRLVQLAGLELALRELIPVAESIPAAAEQVCEYRAALERGGLGYAEICIA